MTFGIRDFAFLVIGVDAGMLLAIGLVLWMRGARGRPRQVIVDTPGYVITSTQRLSRREVEHFRREFLAAAGGLPTVLDSDPARCTPRRDANAPADGEG